MHSGFITILRYNPKSSSTSLVKNIMDYLKFIGAKTSFESKKWGKLTVESQSFTPAADGDLVVFVGDNIDFKNPLVRIHSECVFAETFASNFCDCAEQLDLAMDYLLKNGGGIVFYLRFDGRGAGLSAKVKATELEMQGYDTYESRKMIGVKPEGRDFSKIAEYLKNNNITNIRLLTNSPDKIEGLRNHGINVTPQPLVVDSKNKNIRKLYKTKAEKFGHTISEELYGNNFIDHI